MEPLAPPAFNPHLKRVLKSYQSSALKSLNGPSNYVQGWGDPSKLRPTEMKAMLALEALKREAVNDPTTPNLHETSPKVDIPLVSPSQPSSQQPTGLSPSQMPLFLPMDSSRSEKTETVLERETIACFVVGGEKRLCLPQILNTVLRDFSLQQINNICDELHIFCSRCNAQQLDILKVTGVLPASAPSCGLITKTDAERLCNALLHRTPEKSREPPSPNAFKVYHECFGKCKGLLSPEMYISEYAKCIECFECRGMFSPQKFVVHSHKGLENRTCHWGFDSANWRSYLLLAKDQDSRVRCQRVLEEIKARFDYINRYKRKESPDDEKDETKRVRYDETAPTKVYEWTDPAYCRQVSAFRPWSPAGMTQAIKDGKVPNLAAMAQFREGMSRALPPYLQTGPPVLLNPERVIPHSESSRYERHFAPNVSLAPASQQKGGKDREADFDDDLETSKDRKPETLPLGVHIPSHTPDDREDDILDIDSSSSDFDSSVKSSSDSSVPSTPGPDVATNLTSPRQASDVTSCEGKMTSGEAAMSGKTRNDMRARSVTMLRRALDGDVTKDAEDREAFIQEFVKLQISQEEKIIELEKNNHQLRVELEQVQTSRHEQLREMSESRHALRQDLVQLRRDFETAEERIRELQAELENSRRGPKHDVSQIFGQLAAIEACTTEKKLDADVRRELEEKRTLIIKLLGEDTTKPAFVKTTSKVNGDSNSNDSNHNCESQSPPPNATTKKEAAKVNDDNKAAAAVAST